MHWTEKRSEGPYSRPRGGGEGTQKKAIRVGLQRHEKSCAEGEGIATVGLNRGQIWGWNWELVAQVCSESALRKPAIKLVTLWDGKIRSATKKKHRVRKRSSRGRGRISKSRHREHRQDSQTGQSS